MLRNRCAGLLPGPCMMTYDGTACCGVWHGVSRLEMLPSIVVTGHGCACGVQPGACMLAGAGCIPICQIWSYSMHAPRPTGASRMHNCCRHNTPASMNTAMHQPAPASTESHHSDSTTAPTPTLPPHTAHITPLEWHQRRGTSPHTTHTPTRRLPKASDIIYILQNGTTEQQLAAATQLQQHAGSGRFARRFARLGGTTLLASALAPAAATPVDPAVASMLLQALAKLCKTEGARRAFVEAGGMPAVLAVLPPTPAEPSTPPRGGDQDGSFVIVGEGTPAAPATPAADAEAAVVPAAGGRPGADIVAVIEVLRLLLGDAECKEVAVEAGAPGRLAGLLRGSNMALLRAVLGALGSSLDHPLAREAVRCAAEGRGDVCGVLGQRELRVTCVVCAQLARCGPQCLGLPACIASMHALRYLAGAVAGLLASCHVPA